MEVNQEQQEQKHAHTISIKLWQLIIAVVLVIGITVACSVTVSKAIFSNTAGQTASAAEYNKPETAKNTKKPKVQKSVRGNLIKHIGDIAGYCSDTSCSSMYAQWKVTNITLDYQCPAQSSDSLLTEDAKPENGHYVEFDVEVTTTSEFSDHSYGTLTIGSPADWTYFQKDGTQWNGDLLSVNAINCIPRDQQLPGTIRPGTKALGKLIFDVPSTDGYLVFYGGSSGGFEYPLS